MLFLVASLPIVTKLVILFFIFITAYAIYKMLFGFKIISEEKIYLGEKLVLVSGLSMLISLTFMVLICLVKPIMGY